MSNVKIEKSWKSKLKDEFEKTYWHQLKQFLIDEKSSHIVFPAGGEIFAAFDKTPFNKVKVVILGQDPYHGVGQAHGLSFSVKPGVQIPPSLDNIYKEFKTDLGAATPQNGDLSKWAEEGVLLLNTVLTVRAHEAGSHQKRGWEEFTTAAIGELSEHREHLVFILWGKPAQQKEKLIDTSKHFIIKSPHPSPLAAYRGFFGSKPFSKTNTYLIQQGIKPIDWSLT